MSKSPVYGQQVLVKFFYGAPTQEFTICEVESFSYKQDDTLKENSVLGEAGVGSLDILDNGGTLTFETKKRDSRLVGFFANLSKQLRANENSGQRGRSPYFQVIRETKYVDGTTEKLTFEKVVLYAPEENAGSNKDEVTEKFEGRYVKRYVDYEGAGDASALSPFAAPTFMATAISSINPAEGTIAKSYT